MKAIVIEQLNQRGLTHLFSEKQFEGYKRKILNRMPNSNRYYAALLVFDMFVLNAPRQ